MNVKKTLVALLIIFLAIIFGAFGAHGLKPLLSIDKLSSFEVAVRYQMYGGLLLLLFATIEKNFPFQISKAWNIFFVGILLFSGSIYGLSLGEIIQIDFNFLGPVTPIGGLLMLLSIAILIIKLIRLEQKKN